MSSATSVSERLLNLKNQNNHLLSWAKSSFRLAGYLILTLLLSNCGGHTSRVIDTPETRQLKGWQKPYEVDGKRYQPLRDHHGFTQRGVASWYGRKFHGRKTSNGETYDMYGLSAAHKTLPMGIYVKVTHLGNGQHIIVRINDRGPFVAGRIIDLSYGAAKQLGIVQSGTAKVQIEALGFRKTDHGQVEYQPPVDYDSGSFAVQIGAFAASANAYRLASKMRRDFSKAVVAKGVVNGQTIYRVWVGQFDSLAKAEVAAGNLSAADFPGSYVVAFD